MQYQKKNRKFFSLPDKRHQRTGNTISIFKAALNQKKKTSNWIKSVQNATFLYHITYKQCTRSTPLKLFRHFPQTEYLSLKPLFRSSQELWSEVNNNIESYNIKMNKTADKKKYTKTRFNIGDQILLRNKIIKPTGQLNVQNCFSGPYKIVQ
jgi:hypothetical protein